MKRLYIIILIIIFSITGYSFAEIDPYSFYPSRIYKPKDKVFTKSKDLVSVAPSRPLAVKDKNGNVTYATSDGLVMLKVDNAGNKTFFLQGRKSHARSSKGKLTRKWEKGPEDDKMVVKNEFDEKIAVEEYGNGRVVAEYDEEGNQTKTYKYNEYCTRMQWVVDELSLTKTVYDEKGRALYDLNFEGYRMAEYEYDEQNRLICKTDVYGNKTFYDKEGRTKKTLDIDGNEIVSYNYVKNEYGYNILESVCDKKTGDVTIYRDGKPFEVRNYAGGLEKRYEWLGTKLIYVQSSSGEITWYKNGREKYSTVDGILMKEWLYREGKVVGVWNYQDNSLALFNHGRGEMEIYLDEKPSMEELSGIYEKMGIEF